MTSVRFGRIGALVFGLLLVLPSSTLQRFDGIPFSSGVEFAGLVIWLPVVASPLAAGLLGRTLRRSAARLWLVGVGVLLALKFLLFSAGPLDGFAATYSTPLAAAPNGVREVSFENPWQRFDATRVDRVLDFAPETWHLGFLNSLRFNYHGPDAEYQRDRLPIASTWRGAIARPESGVLTVRYVGEGLIRVGSSTQRLPAAYERERVVPIDVPDGRAGVEVFYRFDPPGGGPAGPYAAFALCVDPPSSTTCSPVRTDVPWHWRVLGAVADMFTMASLLGLAFVSLVACRGRRILLAALLGIGAPAALYWGLDLASGARLVVLICFAVLVAGLRTHHRARHLLAGYFLAAMTMPLTVFAWRGPPGTVWLRSGGDDWLTYEHHARSILELGTLEAGESVFYYQPLFRYIRFAEHMLFGESDSVILSAALVGLVFVMVWTAATMAPRRPVPVSRVLLWWFASMCLVNWILVLQVMVVVQRGLSEYPTWLAIPVAWTLLFRSDSTRGLLGGAAVLAVAVITRTNQMPGLVGLLGAAWLVRRGRDPAPGWSALLVFLAIASLPLMHNVAYGGRWVPLPTSAATPQAVVMPPERWVAALEDSDARSDVYRQVSHVLVLQGADGLRMGARALQLTWIVALVVLWRSPASRLAVAAVLMIPALFLGLHLFYQVDVYYPRHVVAGYLTMALVGLSAANGLASRTDRRADAT